jgi:hypothetical protein
MIPMVIVVRVGLGLAYQGASSTPHHRDPPSSSLSSRVPNSGQISTFQAATHHNNSDTDLHNHTTLVTSSSGSKLYAGIGTDSEATRAGGSSGEKTEEKEGKAD